MDIYTIQLVGTDETKRERTDELKKAVVSSSRNGTERRAIPRNGQV